MEGKLKKEELLKVIQEMEAIEKLPRQLLEELCRVFKVDDASASQNHLIQQFKNKMVDIFIQEADGYMDYLQLPKFRSLGTDSTEKMYLLFRSVWDEYAAYRFRQQVSITKRQIDDITPSFDSSQKMERFHLQLLQIYRDSAICPKSTRTNNKPPTESKPASQPDLNNFLYPNQPLNSGSMGNNQMQNSLYPIFPFSQASSYAKVEAQEGNPYIMENKGSNNHQNNSPAMFDLSRYTLGPHPPFYSPDLYPQLRANTERMEDVPVKNLFNDPLQASSTLFSSYEFIQCVCEGRKGLDDKNILRCAYCQFSYHLACMKFDSSPAVGSICPLCILRRETIFCKVTYEPMKFSWHLNERGKELKVEMTEQESQEIYQARKNGLDCQIRFLKINGRSLRKDKKALDYMSYNGYLQKTARHTEITLPELAEDRHQPISLEIVLRSEDDGNEQSQPKLYLFAVFLITVKKVDEIVGDLFSSKNFVNLDYYSQFMNAQGKVEVTLNDIFGRGQIKYPARGDQCKHADVFDLKNFLQVVSELKKDNNSEINCPICSSPCSYFNYDKFIHNAIQNFPDYEEKKPEGIFIERSGQYFWIGDEGNEEEKIYQSQAMEPQEELMEQQKDDVIQ